jgi:hypothetical protein
MTISILNNKGITTIKVIYTTSEKKDIDSIDDIELIHTDNIQVNPEELKTSVFNAIQAIKEK